MVDFVEKVRADINNIVHHTEVAVEKAVNAVKAEAEVQKTAIATDVRNALAKVQAAVKADAPEIEAAIKKAVSDAVAAVEAALKARGL